MISGLFTLEQLFVGSCHLGVSTAYTVQFVNYLLPKKLEVRQVLTPLETGGARNYNRIGAGINLLGGLARFGDWALQQKWFLLPVIEAVFLKIIAYGTGVFYYFNKAVDASKELVKIDAITSNPRIMTTCTLLERNGLEVKKYAAWASLFSHSVMLTYSGVQLASLLTGVVVLSAHILNVLLVVGVTALLASLFFNISAAARPANKIIVHFDASMGERHTYLA